MKYFYISGGKLVALFFILLCCEAVFAQQSLNINKPGQENRPEISIKEKGGMPFFAQAKRARPFDVNPAVASPGNLSVGHKMRLQLFKDKDFSSTVVRKITDINGVTTLTLKLDNFDYSFAYFTTSGDSYLFTVDIPELNEKYITREHRQKDLRYLFLLDNSKIEKLKECKIPQENPKNKKGGLQKDEQKMEGENLNSSPLIQTSDSCNVGGSPDVETIIDVMVVYTPSAQEWANVNDGGIFNTIANAMAVANTISANSSLDIRFNLVSSILINYSEDGPGEDFSRLSGNGDGYMDEVHTMRVGAGADLVAMLGSDPNGSGILGIGNLLNTIYGDFSKAFTWTKVQTASYTYTFAHELGHNLGAGHSKFQKSGPGPTSWQNWEENTWSAGWRWESTDANMYTTVMAYPYGSSYDDRRSATQIPYFSDPGNIYLGANAGHASDGDNSRTIRFTRKLVADYSDKIEYCTAGGASAGASFISNVTIGGINHSSGRTSYSDFSSLSACVVPQEKVPLQVKIDGFGSEKNLAGWIDWNDDKFFDPVEELLFADMEETSLKEFEVVIPLGITPGPKRMRIRLHEEDTPANTNPCDIFGYGEVEDYTLNVLQAPACEQAITPVNLVASGVHSTGFELQWDPVSGVNSYSLKLRSNGGSWSEISSVGTASYKFGNLESSALYEVQVASLCSGVVSGFSSVLQLTTPTAASTISFVKVPSGGQAGNILPVVEIALLDNAGNVSDSQKEVTLSLVREGGSGVLTGTTTVTTKEGIATFSDLLIETEGSYQFLATAAGLPEQYSVSFTVTAFEPTTLLVNSVEDGGDADLNDALCADGNGDCTLRAAIENANRTRGMDKIHFNIPGEGLHTILLTQQLPPVTAPVELDATTQPGYRGEYPAVMVDGKNVIWEGENVAYGFLFLKHSSGSTVRGFAMGGFNPGVAIYALRTGGHILQSNFIGTTADGIGAFGNRYGIYLEDSNSNRIGGAGVAEGNLISGNTWYGLGLDNSQENFVSNNIVGLNKTKTDSISNGYGIINVINSGAYWETSLGYSSDNLYENNFISGNKYYGLYIWGWRNRVVNNYIGVDHTSHNAFPNQTGIFVFGGGQNIIGESANGNVISGNTSGVIINSSEENIISNNRIGTNEEGSVAVPNDTGVKIGGDKNILDGNVISGNLYSGIEVNSSSNVLINNIVGLNRDGTSSLPNLNGIRLQSGSNNSVGQAGAPNVISGNQQFGIRLENSTHENTITGNVLGTNLSGTEKFSGRVGISLYGSDNNIIGGNGAGEGNLITGHLEDGIWLNVSFHNKLLGNTISLNGFNGVVMHSSTYSNRISKNSFYENSRLGIDLSYNGISPNDSRDRDTGANQIQNYPEVENGASLQNGQLHLSYIVPSDPAYSFYPFTVEFFRSDGNRQGKEYLATDVFLEADYPKGKNTKAVVLNLAAANSLQPGDYIVATATDANGNTSEFSPQVQVTGNCEVQKWYADVDGDGFGIDSAESNVSSCTRPADNFVLTAGDCDDTDAGINPQAEDIPDDGIDQNCDGIDATTVIVDSDGDGFEDSVDNCPETANVDQADANGNGIGDACETAACLGTDVLNVSECTSGSLVYWTVTNPGACTVEARWEVRKGSESGVLYLGAGDSQQFTSSVASKGQTQIILYWKDSSGTETKVNMNASGTSCATAAAFNADLHDGEEDNMANEAPVVYPNPVMEYGFYISFSKSLGGRTFEANIFDFNGRLIETRSLTAPPSGGNLYWETDTNRWETGVHILHLNSGSNSFRLNLMKE